ncbi:hypothetical protein PILCRDRAFT_10199 [Piloderma croceum F 1598]|uniref:F-box domain-containing protein n=1 Tax=Piloderma croceum (strain F 1598) TaxID=765440 RepID=A0A0C3FIX8_PILCF|nr:hypothetical protein PILCRDRAFT_10199 [Piloderma croceum F 1598]
MSQSQLQAPSPFTRLPTELVHYILQLAAASSRHCCLDICLVASWARRIALPSLLDTIVVDDEKAFLKYITDPSHMPPKPNFLTVNRIWLGYFARPNRILHTVFDACERITHLALGNCHWLALVRFSSQFGSEKGMKSNRFLMRNQDLHVTLLEAPLARWSELYYTYYATPRPPIFDRITHMRLKSLVCGYDDPPIKLHCFSRLSHLCVPYCLGGRVKLKQLRHFLDLESLEIFVIAMAEDVIRKGHWKRLEKWVRKTRETDRRVYLVESGSNFRDKWEYEMRGGESIWDQAVRYTDGWERHTNMKSAFVLDGADA